MGASKISISFCTDSYGVDNFPKMYDRNETNGDGSYSSFAHKQKGIFSYTFRSGTTITIVVVVHVSFDRSCAARKGERKNIWKKKKKTTTTTRSREKENLMNHLLDVGCTHTTTRVSVPLLWPKIGRNKSRFSLLYLDLTKGKSIALLWIRPFRLVSYRFGFN